MKIMKLSLIMHTPEYRCKCPDVGTPDRPYQSSISGGYSVTRVRRDHDPMLCKLNYVVVVPDRFRLRSTYCPCVPAPFKVPIAFSYLTIFIMALNFATLFLTALILARVAAECSGYRATNIREEDSYITADLTLIGPCNSFSQDIENLTLLVEYQTGVLSPIS